MIRIKEYFVFISENSNITLILFLAVIIFILAKINIRKVTLKKRKTDYKNKIKFVRIRTFIDKTKILKRYIDNTAINLNLITGKSEKTNLEIAYYYMYLYLIISAAAVIFGIIFFKTIFKFILPLGVIISIPAIFNNFIVHKRKKAVQEFGEVVSTFTSQFAYSGNVLTALEKSINDIPESQKIQFSRLISAMKTEEDYKSAVDTYAKSINYDMCYAFTEILKASYYDNTGTTEALIELEDLIASEKKSAVYRNGKLNKRKGDIYFWIVCNIFFLLIDFWALGDYVKHYFYYTFAGQVTMLLVFLFIALSIITIIIIDNI